MHSITQQSVVLFWKILWSAIVRDKQIYTKKHVSLIRKIEVSVTMVITLTDVFIILTISRKTQDIMRAVLYSTNLKQNS
jgi:hypothetical protein